MKCDNSKHIFGIDHDMEFVCSVCFCIFVESNRVTPWSGQYGLNEIRNCLKKKYGKKWKYYWYQLVATRELVRKIRMAYKTKDSDPIVLDEMKIYTLSDFTKDYKHLNKQDI